MLLRQPVAPKPVEDHHRAFYPCFLQLFEGLARSCEGFSLVDPRQNFVITGFGSDIDERQAKRPPVP